MVKMIDVARRAGVSTKTVSRVLNNEPYVRPDVRDKVMLAVQDLGYVPSQSARSLRSLRNYRILMISHTSDSHYINTLSAGSLKSCQDRGYLFVLALLENVRQMSDAILKDRAAEILSQSKPDGVILAAPLSDNAVLRDVLTARGIPVTIIGPSRLDTDSGGIHINERRAANELTAHLISLGHRRIAHIKGKAHHSATHERLGGFRDAMAQAGLEINEAHIFDGDFGFESGAAAGQALLAMASPPTAVFAANDHMAAGVIQAAHKLKLDLPSELSVVGFDDAEFAQRIWPSLTTVRQPLLDFGSAAAAHLIARIEGTLDAGGLPPRPLDHEIIIRDSTAAWP